MKNFEPFTVYILDDDQWYGTMLHYFLSLNPEFKVKRFEDPLVFLEAMKETPEAVTLDYSMPGMNGIEVMEKIKTKNPETEVIMISSHEDINIAIQSMKKGAWDYIVKNQNANDNLRNSLKQIRNKWQIKVQSDYFSDPLLS